MSTGREKAKIIINGDDFGLSEGVNRAIKDLHHHGRLNSTSLLVNTDWSEDAMEFCKSSPDLRVGIHLNLTTGSPLAGPDAVFSLVRRDGRFYDLPIFLSRFLAGTIKIEEVELELRSQIEKALKSGVQPHHLDSHMHFHAVPALAELISNLAGYYGISKARNPNLSAFLMPSPAGDSQLLDAIYGTCGRILSRTQAMLDRRSQGLTTVNSQSDQLIYLRWCLQPGRDPAVLFQNCIDQVDGNVLEIVAHPAEIDNNLPEYSSYVEGRQDEYSFLNSERFADLLEENQLVLL